MVGVLYYTVDKNCKLDHFFKKSSSQFRKQGKLQFLGLFIHRISKNKRL